VKTGCGGGGDGGGGESGDRALVVRRGVDVVVLVVGGMVCRWGRWRCWSCDGD